MTVASEKIESGGGWLDLSETLTSQKKRRLCMTLYSFAQYFPNGLFLINFFFLL